MMNFIKHFWEKQYNSTETVPKYRTSVSTTLVLRAHYLFPKPLAPNKRNYEKRKLQTHIPL
jgi:hypothetical protein